MNSTPGVALPTIATPGPGMHFEDWMDATNVFDAIVRTQNAAAARPPSPSSARTRKPRHAS